MKVMVGFSRKKDVLFAVCALADGHFDSKEDRRAFSETIVDYFVYGGSRTENKCSMQTLSLL